MTSAPSKTTTVKTVNNKTGITTSTSTSTSGGSTTTTKTTTIGTAKTVSTPSTATKATATLPHAALGSKWISGPNDGGWALCAPVAVANACLGALGVTASNAAIERLYARAGGSGTSGVSLGSTFGAARQHGLYGCRLKGWRRAALDDADIVLLKFAKGCHAAAFAGMTVITWGDEIPLAELDATIIDAWSLTWHGQEEVTRG